MTDAAEPVQPPAVLQTLVTWQVGKIATIAARLTAQRMPLGARTDSAVLAALEEYGPLSQADLGRRLGLDRNDVNAVLNRLQAAARVSRQADPMDRRRNRVEITADGSTYLADILQYAQAVQRELLTGLTTAEHAQLTALLGKVLRSHPSQPA